MILEKEIGFRLEPTKKETSQNKKEEKNLNLLKDRLILDAKKTTKIFEEFLYDAIEEKISTKNSVEEFKKFLNFFEDSLKTNTNELPIIIKIFQQYTTEKDEFQKEIEENIPPEIINKILSSNMSNDKKEKKLKDLLQKALKEKYML